MDEVTPILVRKNSSPEESKSSFAQMGVKSYSKISIRKLNLSAEENNEESEGEE